MALILLSTIICGSFSNFAYNNIINYKIISGSRNISDTSASTFADLSTVDSYKSIITNEEQGGRYNGRIWTDKSVYAHDETSAVTLDDRFTEEYDEDFLTVFSTLGSSQSFVGLPPAKTIIVIDNSGSMFSNSTTFTNTRVYKTVTAVNETIDKLMRQGKYNQIGVVLFGNNTDKDGITDDEEDNTAKLIVPIGHYPVSENESEPYKYIDAGWKSNEVPEGAPEEPYQVYDSNLKNNGAGWIYVDKKYVNDNFIVNNELDDKKGTERYDCYRNGTTNIQAGIYKGFDELLNTEKYVTVSGYKFEYVPNMIFLTDGAATDMLNGVFSNPVDENQKMEAAGFTNDRGDKVSSFVKGYTTNGSSYTYFWNMLCRLENINGEDIVKQVGYGDGTCTQGTLLNNGNPGEEGRKELEKLALDFRSTQGTMMLSTLMTAGYMKSAVEKEYGEECKVYTISVDMPNPDDINVPDPIGNSDSYEITTNQFMVNPKNFSKEYLINKGYLKTSDESQIGEETTAYEHYTIGSEIILSVCDALDAFNEWKENSNVTIARDKLKTYIIWTEYTDLYTEMKNGRVTINGEEYKAQYPIGPNHSNAFFCKYKRDIAYPNLEKGSNDNPYNLTNDEVDINYVSKSYYASSTQDTENSIKIIFDQVVSDIINPPFSPIGTDINEAGIKGDLTYVDPIGKYLEVKDVNKLLLFGKEYNIIKDGEEQTEEIGDQTITKQYYKAVNLLNGDETIVNGAYGEKVKFNLSDIKIWKEISNDYDTGENRDIDTNFDEALHITIPREAIPIQLDTIEFDQEGKIIRYDSNTGTDESLPLRIIYEVGISEKIINEKGKIDLSRLSQEYFTQHKKTINEADYIEFLSNYYSNENYDKETNDTYGNAAATFVPSDENRFYIFQKNLPIYKKSEGGDENGEGILKEEGFAEGTVTLSEEVTNLNEIENDKTYYFAIDFFVPYEGEDGEKGKVEKYVLAYKGSEFYTKNNECSLTYYDKIKDEEVSEPGENIVVATKIGGKRVGNIEKLAVRKEENKTDTANMVSAPEYGGPNNLDSIVDYMGNNGKLRISATWLFINKVVNANVEKDHFYEPVNEEFEFKLDIDGDIGTENAIIYGVYTWNGRMWIPEKEKVYVVTDNEGYILNSEEKRTTYWVGNSEDEREVGEDGTITVYTDDTKSESSTLQVFKDEDKLQSDYKITATLKTKKLTFTPTGEGDKVTTTFTLKDGEGLLLSSLNPGTKWTVTENLTEDQIRRNFNFEDITGRENDEDIVINDKTISGVTEAGLTDEANYRNIFEEIFKTLTIEKEVPGKAGDKEKEWEFEIKLTPPKDVVLYDEYSYTGGNFDEEVEALEDGKIEFVKNEDGTSSGKIKLKHGQSVTIINLPNGTQYEVTELEANTNDYTTTSSNEAGTLNENKTVRFTNIMRTMQFEFTKVKNENLNESLPGTKFKLYKLVCTDETHIEEHNKLIDESNLSECWKLYDEVQSDEDGKVTFTELVPHEEYRLVETKAVFGRTKPEGQWRIICSSYEDDVRIIAIQGKQMPPAFVEESEGKLLLPNMPYYILPLSGSNTALMLTIIGCVQTLIGLVIMIIVKSIKRKRD